MASWLGKQGYAIQKKEELASYRINIIAAALGTELGDSFFGMPPVTSQLIPFSLPELAIYKNQYQTGLRKVLYGYFRRAGRHAGPFVPLPYRRNILQRLYFPDVFHFQLDRSSSPARA